MVKAGFLVVEVLVEPVDGATECFNSKEVYTHLVGSNEKD